MPSAELFSESCQTQTISITTQGVSSPPGGHIQGFGCRLGHGLRDFFAVSGPMELGWKEARRIAGARFQGKFLRRLEGMRDGALEREGGSGAPFSCSRNHIRAAVEAVRFVASRCPGIELRISLQRQRKSASVSNDDGVQSRIAHDFTRLEWRLISNRLGPVVTDSGIASAPSSNPEAIERLLLSQSLGSHRRLPRSAVVSAKSVSERRIPALIVRGTAGVLVHEVIGHMLEAQADEAATRLLARRIGQRIAASSVTVVDSPAGTGEWVEMQCDDEGSPALECRLIESGILRNLIVDSATSKSLKLPNFGHARRQSYSFRPAPRMRSTYLAPGSRSFADLISAMDSGILIKRLGTGAVDRASGRFRFTCAEAYRVRRGRSAERLGGLVISGDSHQIMNRIQGIGDAVAHQSALCRADSGDIQVTVGSPDLLVEGLEFHAT